MQIFKGRLNRTTFLLGNLMFAGVAYVISSPSILNFIETNENNFAITFFAIVIFAALLINGVSIYVRRLHDLGLSGWLWPIMILPAIDIALLILKGQQTDNKYGSPPKTLFDFKSLF